MTNSQSYSNRKQHAYRKLFNYIRIIGIAVTVLAVNSKTKADVELIKIGNPVFEPTDFALTATRLDHSFTNVDEYIEAIHSWTTNALGENHVLEVGTGRLLPGSFHEGHDDEMRRKYAASGSILTDVITVSQFRGRNMYMTDFGLVPTESAPLGDSPNGANIPILPNEIFPLSVHSRTHHNGKDPGGEWTDAPPLIALPKLTGVTDENGEVRDFSGLNWSHVAVRGGVGNFPSVPTSEIVGNWLYETEVRDINGNGWDVIIRWDVVDRASRVDGDLSHNGELDMHDLDLLVQNVAVDATNLKLDLNDDDTVNVNDVHYWVTDLKNTWIGDANLDGEFNSGDFVQVFSTGKYETDETALWSEGDWNADMRFDSGDFVTAFQGGGYEMGTRGATVAVPEPSGWLLAALGITGVLRHRRMG